MLLATLQLGNYGTNCYIVGSKTTKEGMIIDPGAEAKRILQTVNKAGLSIKLIAITHGHMDHTGALEEVRKQPERRWQYIRLMRKTWCG